MTLYEDLIEAGIEVESADDATGRVVFLPGKGIGLERVQIFEELLTKYLRPTEYADLLAARSDQQQIRDEYQSAVTRLTQIETFTGTVTLVILGGAVKDIARILRLLLKLLARQHR